MGHGTGSRSQSGSGGLDPDLVSLRVAGHSKFHNAKFWYKMIPNRKKNVTKSQNFDAKCFKINIILAYFSKILAKIMPNWPKLALKYASWQLCSC